MNISILLPTRKRTQALTKSVTSLLERAENPANLEILIAYDNDDTESSEYFAENGDWVQLMKKYNTNTQVAECEPQGYLNLNTYVNGLAEASKGHLLMFWNDDAEMLTDNWDSLVWQNKNYFGLLRMPCVNQPHPFALFPIIPAKWTEIFGCVSPVNHSDWWIYNVCVRMNRIKNLPIEVIHNRADVNGENNDETYKNNSYALDGRSPHDPRDYSHPQRQKDLSDWVTTLMLYGYPHEA